MAVSAAALLPLQARAAAAPIFVLNSLDATVSVIDAVTHVEIKRLDVGKEPHHVYLSPDQRSLLVGNAAANSITFIDPRTAEIQRTLNGVIDPYQLRFSPDMRWFVTAANRRNHVDIFRVSQPASGGFELALAKRISASQTPSHIMIDSKSTVAYISLQDSDTVMAIDLATQTPRWTTPVGKMPADVFLSPDDRTLFIGLTGDSFVEAYDVSGAQPRLVKRIRTGDGAHAFRSWGDQRHLLVSNRVANTISRIDMQSMTVVDTYPAPGGPDCIEVSADRKTIMVTSRWARKLSYIDVDTKAVTRQVNVGRSPHGVWTLDHASPR